MLGLLLPHLAGTAVDGAGIDGDLVAIEVRAAAGGAACPGCGFVVHEGARPVRAAAARCRDRRAPGGDPAGGTAAAVRQCGLPEGSFAEQPAGLAVPYARKTPLLAGQLAAVAAALAGRAGSRLARRCWRWRSAGTP